MKASGAISECLHNDKFTSTAKTNRSSFLYTYHILKKWTRKHAEAFPPVFEHRYDLDNCYTRCISVVAILWRIKMQQVINILILQYLT